MYLEVRLKGMRTCGLEVFFSRVFFRRVVCQVRCTETLPSRHVISGAGKDSFKYIDSIWETVVLMAIGNIMKDETLLTGVRIVDKVNMVALYAFLHPPN